MNAEHVKLGAVDRVVHAGMALPRPDLADDPVGGIHVPVDRAHVLGHRCAGAGANLRQPLDSAGGFRVAGDPIDRLHDRLDRASANLVPVQAALLRLAHRERACRPDRSGIGLPAGLDHGHAPFPHAELDRPVKRRRPAVTPRPGMDDQTAIHGPDRLRDQRFQERAHDQLRTVLVDDGLHPGGGVGDRDRHLVTSLGQFDQSALAQSIVGRHHEQDPQRPRRRVHRRGRRRPVGHPFPIGSSAVTNEVGEPHRDFGSRCHVDAPAVRPALAWRSRQPPVARRYGRRGCTTGSHNRHAAADAARRHTPDPGRPPTRAWPRSPRGRRALPPTALRSPICGLMTCKPVAPSRRDPSITGRSNIQFWTFDRS
jgi:hypothetical protein